MANRGLFTILIVLLGLGILFAGGMNLGYETATQDVAVTNESITVDYAASVAVAEPTAEVVTYNDTATVYNSTGAALEPDTDYVWHADNGTVEWIDTNATADGETATISYDYAAPPEQNQAAYGVIEIISIGLVFMVFLLVGQWLFDVVGDW